MADATPKNSPAKGSEDLDQLMKDIATIKADFATLLGDVKEGRLKGAANVGINRLSDEVSDVYDRVAARGHEGVRTVESYIEKNPVPCLLGAAAVGLLLGRLLSR